MNNTARTPTEEEVSEWWLHPVTEAFMVHLRKLREEIKEDLACGVYTAEDPQGTLARYAKAVAQCEILEKLLDPKEMQFKREDE